MGSIPSSVSKTLQNKKVHRSIGAVAGFASALSVMVGTLAGYATPRGWGRVSLALHMTHKPLIMRLAPVMTGIAVAIATCAGLLGFYLWVIEPAEPTAHTAESKTDGEG